MILESKAGSCIHRTNRAEFFLHSCRLLSISVLSNDGSMFDPATWLW
jgi:hypothetical protein